MNDDDRTLDADDGMLDELKRLAAEAKASVGVSTADTDTDATMDADDSAMEELRRFAAEARAAQRAEPAVADDEELEVGPLDGAPAVPVAAPSKESATVPLGDIPHIDLPPQQLQRARPNVDVPRFESVTRPQPEPEQRDATQLRGDVSRDLAAPPPVDKGDGWRPPPRMVMPTEPERREAAASVPWKYVAVGLGAALVVLVAVLAFGVLGGDDAPVDVDVPTSDVVEPGPADGSEPDG